MSILITGGTGILGKALKKFYPTANFPSHSELDVSDLTSVKAYFEKIKPDLVIHAAAMTKVRLCEEQKDIAWKTNVGGTKNIVQAILESNKDVQFIYISTACVFDGHQEMYDENSLPYPENFYALTKLLGEQQVSKLKNYLIVRTNFVGKQPWPYPKAFTDRFGTYLFAEQVAQGIFDVQQEHLQEIVHIVGKEKMSMYDLAKLTTPNIEPMTLSDYSGPPLTIDMSLDTKKWKKYEIS